MMRAVLHKELDIQMLRFRVVLALLWTFAAISPLSAQTARDLMFREVALDEGLSQSTVTSITQDKYGFIWFGTTDGLNRYDGFVNRTYKYDRHDSSTVSYSWILKLFTDSRNHLWVGTERGFSMYHSAKDRFYRFWHREVDDEFAPLGQRIMGIDESKEGDIWTATDRGVSVYRSKTGRFDHYYTEAKDSSRIIPGGYASTLAIDKNNQAWVTLFGVGVVRIDTETDQIVNETTKPWNKELSNYTNVIYVDAENRLWFGGFSGTVVIVEADRTTYSVITASDLKEEFTEVHSIMEGLDGQMWMATNNGLIRLAKNRFKMGRYIRDFSYEFSIRDVQFYTLFLDRAKNLWVGTQVYGAQVADLKPRKFKHFNHIYNDPSSIIHDNVWAITTDSENRIWIGTDQGVSFGDVKTKKFQHLTSKGEKGKVLSHNQISAITEANGEIFIATSFAGLNRRKKDGTVVWYTTANSGIGSNQITAIKYHKTEQRIWIATYAGLYYLDLQTNKVEKFVPGTQMDYSFEEGYIWVMHTDPNDVLWVGTDVGVMKYNTDLESFSELMLKYNGVSRELESVYGLATDKSGYLWIGTGEGLFRFDTRDNSTLFFSEEDGLPNNFVYGVIVDNRNHTWISTNKGLCEVIPLTADPLHYRFRNYDVLDGLQKNEFNSGSWHKSEDGAVYFGGINGFNEFRPEEIQSNPYEPPVVISEVSILKQNKEVQLPTFASDNFTVNYSDNVLSIHFAALDFTQTKKNRFMYKLVGFDEDWVFSERNFAIYTNLYPKNYTFEVRASNNDGLWNLKGDMLKISVIPPFYMTYWFYSLLAVFAVSMIVVSVKWRERRLKATNLYLESEVSRRTEELSQSEQVFRSISENAVELISMVDQNGQLFYVSPSHERVLGYRPESLLGTNVLEMVHPDDVDLIQSKTRLLYLDGQILFGDYRLRHKDGHYIEFQASGSLINTNKPTGPRVVLIAHDVSKQAKIQRHLKQSKEAAERANRAKSAFLAGISHELRTPLNAILGFAQILNRDESLNKRQKDFVQTMYTSGNHLLQMINDVLDISKIEAGRMNLAYDNFSLRELVNDIHGMFRMQCENKGLYFDVDIDPTLPEFLFADAGKLRQILINLVGNAVKFTSQGGIKLTLNSGDVGNVKEEHWENMLAEPAIEVPDGVEAPELKSKRKEGQPVGLYIEVRDSGKGIPKEFINTIFEPFQQIEGTERYSEGTGLGLAISSRLVHLMEGTIEVESAVKVGSTFKVFLPVLSVDKPSLLTKGDKNIVKAISGKKQVKVLLVDDVPYNLTLLEAILEPIGFICNTAMDGKQAIETFKLWQPDIILMDLRMPVMKGEEALKVIRTLPGGTLPVIAISASGFRETRDSMVKFGFDEYIRKPFTEMELLNTMARFGKFEYILKDETKAEQLVQEELNAERDAENIHRIAEAIQEELNEAETKQLSEAVELMDWDALERAAAALSAKHPALSEILFKICDEKDYSILLSLNEQLNK